MRAGRWIVIGMFAMAAAVVAVGVLLRRATGPRSIVLITIDTLRADRLGAYGRSPSITPELDALAARGVVFEKAWTVAPLTVPSHATLLTGLLPPKHGLRVNQPDAPLPAPNDRRFFTLAETLRDQGYATGAFVSASVLRGDDTGLAAGFDVYDEVPRAAAGSLHDAERRGEDTVAKALDWAKSQERAVFLWVHLFDPHAPYDAPVGWGAGPAHVADAQGYDGEVAYTDHCVGLLLKGVADAGRGDCVVAVVADHGELLGEHGEPSHGYLLHEATLHVPMIFAMPGLAPARRAEPVSTVDVFPTLLALTGQPIPPQINGMPLVAKSADEHATRPIYAESLYGWHACRWAQQFALRRGDEKLVLSGPRSMVFDLSKDPREEHPAAPDENQRGALSQLMLVAREAALGRLTEATPTTPLVDYVGGGSGEPTTVLAEADNAKLASPYDRMDVLAAFNQACGLVKLGHGVEAVAQFEEILRTDPGNLEAAYWKGRALELQRDKQAEAAEAYRRAFDIGFRSPKCVVKALQCALRVIDAPDSSEASRTAESDRSDGFLVEARAKGLRDDADTFTMEAALRLKQRDFEACEAALRRAAKCPHDAAAQDRIDQCRELLEQARKKASGGR